MDTRFEMPPRIAGADGITREVAIEIEFTGLRIPEAARIVTELFGGRIQREDRLSLLVRGTRLGDFRVEANQSVLEHPEYREALSAAGVLANTRDKLESAMDVVARKFVPTVIFTPRLPVNDVSVLDIMRHALQKRGALGTNGSVVHASGFKIDIEAPNTEAETIHDYTSSFLLLYESLVEKCRVDIATRIVPRIEPFPEAYRQRVLEATETPTIDGLIDDYLAFNATTQRPLDLLPLFAALRPDRVRAAVVDSVTIEPRACFSYRLPNCLIDDPSWSFAEEWNRWVLVERLAGDKTRLDGLRNRKRTEARPSSLQTAV